MKQTLHDSGSQAMILTYSSVAATAWARRATKCLLLGLAVSAMAASLSACAPFSSQFASASMGDPGNGAPSHYIDQGPNANYPFAAPAPRHMRVAESVPTQTIDMGSQLPAQEIGITAKPTLVEPALGV